MQNGIIETIVDYTDEELTAMHVMYDQVSMKIVPREISKAPLPKPSYQHLHQSL